MYLIYIYLSIGILPEFSVGVIYLTPYVIHIYIYHYISCCPLFGFSAGVGGVTVQVLTNTLLVSDPEL